MDYATARHNMVESQIRPNRVTDEALVDAMDSLPRESFLPKLLADVAYVDEALAVAPGRYMMEPMVVAHLAQAARITADDVVLLIGCGAGYTAAVLARLASTVVAVESDTALIEAANARFAELGIDTVAVVTGELTAGYAAQAPYDVIVFNGAVADVPQTILDQLSVGGRCVAVVEALEPELGSGKVTVIERTRDAFKSTIYADAGTPLLPGFAPEPRFTF